MNSNSTISKEKKKEKQRIFEGAEVLLKSW